MQTPTSLIEAVRRTLRTMQQGKDPDSIASKSDITTTKIHTLTLRHLMNKPFRLCMYVTVHRKTTMLV